MTQPTQPSESPGSTVAHKIARSFQTSPKPIRVIMRARSEVASLFKQFQRAQERAHDRPQKVH